MNGISLYREILSNSFKAPTIKDIKGLEQFENDVKQDKRISFREIMNNEIEKVNNQQIKADELTKGFITGEVEDLHSVLIATEEARLSLELAVQVRNKVIEGFREINNMQL